MEANSIFLQIPQNIRDEAAAASSELLPTKSKERYVKEYEAFTMWRKNKNVCGVNEDILLCYLTELSKKFAPNSLWSKISMLKTYLKLHENVDISRLVLRQVDCFDYKFPLCSYRYGKVFTLLRRKSECYKPNKAKVLTTEEVTRYLVEASDKQHLLEKVITVFGIFGACRREELLLLRVDNIEDTGRFLIVRLEDTKNKSSRKFTITEDDTPFQGCTLYRKYAALRPSGLENQRVFVDYRNGKCTRQFVGIHKIGKIPKKIAEFLNLEEPAKYTGHTFRRSAATMLVENGGDLLTLKKFGGWKSSAVAEQYVEESISKKIKISKQLFNSSESASTSASTLKNCNSSTSRKQEEFANAAVPSSKTLSCCTTLDNNEEIKKFIISGNTGCSFHISTSR